MGRHTGSQGRLAATDGHKSHVSSLLLFLSSSVVFRRLPNNSYTRSEGPYVPQRHQTLNEGPPTPRVHLLFVSADIRTRWHPRRLRGASGRRRRTDRQAWRVVGHLPPSSPAKPVNADWYGRGKQVGSDPEVSATWGITISTHASPFIVQSVSADLFSPKHFTQLTNSRD